eukprot:8933113-Pyramimonas_sp.AAC.2
MAPWTSAGYHLSLATPFPVHRACFNPIHQRRWHDAYIKCAGVAAQPKHVGPPLDGARWCRPCPSRERLAGPIACAVTPLE